MSSYRLDLPAPATPERPALVWIIHGLPYSPELVEHWGPDGRSVQVRLTLHPPVRE